MNTFWAVSHDKWKPEGYTYFDFLLQHPLMMKNESLSSKFDKKIPLLTQQIIKDRNKSSRVFWGAKIQLFI